VTKTEVRRGKTGWEDGGDPGRRPPRRRDKRKEGLEEGPQIGCIINKMGQTGSQVTETIHRGQKEKE